MLQAIGGVPQPAQETLNQRLNSVGSQLDFAMERIECVLGKVNGTPQGGLPAGKSPDAPQYSMGDMVSRLESQSQRLSELAKGVERIA